MRGTPAPMMEPAVAELPPDLQPEQAFQALAGLPHAIFFDSALRDEKLGRYSYVAADPCRWLVVEADGRRALPLLEDFLPKRPTPRVGGLPPWQGGAAGMIAYEIGQSLERIPAARWDEFRLPALAFGLYDCVVAFDHFAGKAWAISQGLPEGDPPARRRRARARLDGLLDRLDGDPLPAPTHEVRRLDRRDLSPTFEPPGREGLLSDFTREGYLGAVSEVVELLRAGEAYQVNLSQRLLAPDPGDAYAMYLRLRERNPAPFGAFFDGGPWRIASASPERFLRLERGEVETRPIKGTRPRGATREEDQRLGEGLVASEKERAENVMIVDLLRNDLSRVCHDDSIEVSTLFGLERYARVQHLVSAVTGRLGQGLGVCDLLAATLPGGSVTGAPKVRAQQVIARLEPTARGAYCGALAWIGLPDEEGHSAMDSSVLIRTVTQAAGWLQLPVGGGVVVQSDPAAEYEETWHKAAGLIDAILP